MAASILHQTNTEGTYTFASQPRAVPQQRKKYRPISQEDEVQNFYGNIMFDRRVIRGSNYAQPLLPASAVVDPIEVQRQQEARRREIARRRMKQQPRTRSPAPVEGRRHMDVQTELYLEELSDRVEETEAECQTDTFLDRPPSPLFIPAKTGVDKDTQILEGELFDFNREVQPVLEVLCGKTMEQALLEVMEEEELANLREQQRVFEELRNAELAEYQRLEEQERRHRVEKERRMKEQEEAVRKEKETADKIAARAFAHSYMADLIPAVFGNLTNNGYFYDAVEREVERSFMPWLADEVDKRIQGHIASRRLLDGMIREVVKSTQDQFKELHEREAREQLAARPPTFSQEEPTPPGEGVLEPGEEGDVGKAEGEDEQGDDEQTGGGGGDNDATNEVDKEQEQNVADGSDEE